jgi:hypothetical protein
MRKNLKETMKNISVSCLGSSKIWIIPLLVWIFLTSSSLLWNLYSLRQNTFKTFRSEAQILAEVALSTMLWAEQHKRVFVPLTEWIPMEPFYAQLPATDLLTTCGLRLTQVSPGAIIRQQAELAWLHGLTRKSIRVTSLKSVNPVNAPDQWESDTLKLFENGQTDRFALVGDGPEAMLKYMVPIRAKAAFLEYPQGGGAGDLLGGLSVRERAASRFAMIRPQIISIIATHAAIFMVVALAMLVLLFRLRRQWLNIDV